MKALLIVAVALLGLMSSTVSWAHPSTIPCPTGDGFSMTFNHTESNGGHTYCWYFHPAAYTSNGHWGYIQCDK